MAADLPADRDLTLIFERDDVRDAFAGHCAKTHEGEDMHRCPYCRQLLTTLANAIIEWKGVCDLEPKT